MNKEEWKDIPNYEGLYQASNLGNIRSIYRYKKIIKPYIDKDGYYRIRLYKNKKGTYKGVHKWVAETFIPNPHNYKEINHKDENKTNNRIENLEWCDNWYNIHYGTAIERQTKSRSKQIGKYLLDDTLVEIYESISDASKENDIPISNIYKVLIGERKTAGGYIWKLR